MRGGKKKEGGENRNGKEKKRWRDAALFKTPYEQQLGCKVFRRNYLPVQLYRRNISYQKFPIKPAGTATHIKNKGTVTKLKKNNHCP